MGLSDRGLWFRYSRLGLGDSRLWLCTKLWWGWCKSSVFHCDYLTKDLVGEMGECRRHVEDSRTNILHRVRF